MAASFRGIETVCTVTHFCQTLVFEFPGSHPAPEKLDDNQVIFESGVLKATVVSDLAEYFEQGYSPFPHYSIDVSLHAGIDRVTSEGVSHGKSTRGEIYLVVEQFEQIPATTFASGECFLIDEVQGEEEVIEGGRAGMQALLAFRTGGGVWPEFFPDVPAVNTVLAAVKVEQNITHPITKHYSCSCLVSDDGRAVYTMHPKMNIAYGGLRVTKPVNVGEFQQKIARIRLIHDGLKRDAEEAPQVAELIDSVLLDNKKDDAHFRLWYLRLWQAARRREEAVRGT